MQALMAVSLIPALAMTFAIQVLYPSSAKASVRSTEAWGFNQTRLIGYNWADPRDNFQSGGLYLSGLSSTDVSQTNWSAAANKIATVAKAASPSTNTIRIPINYATVNTSDRLGAFQAAIDELVTDGMNVIIGYWPDGRDGLGIPYGTVNESNWLSAWGTMFSRYADNSQVYFEPINEPWGYSTYGQADTAGTHDTGDLDPLKQLYRDWAANMLTQYNSSHTPTLTSLPAAIKHRTILAGGMVEEDVKDLANTTEFDDYLLGFHMYNFVWEEQHGNLISSCNTCATTQPRLARQTDWPVYLAWLINNHWPRVVITEFGSDTGAQGYDNPDNGYSSNSVAGTRVPSIQGIANYAYTFGVGMIYWPGFRAKYNTTDGTINSDEQSTTPTTSQSLALDSYNMFASGTESSPGSNMNSRYNLFTSTPTNPGLLNLFNKASQTNPNLQILRNAVTNGCTSVKLNSYAGLGGALFNRGGWASQQYGWNTDTLQLCDTNNGDGFFNIADSSGNVLDIQGNSTTAGASLDFYSNNNNSNQRWLPISAALADGSYVYLASEYTYQLVEVRGNPPYSDSQANDLDQWPLAGGQANQRWQLSQA
ncbi:cellulase family glycosylhydrolase [Kitasatospora kifunensis]|uniref:Ricin B lectin domain-containing protein n=1 Tax=Kitasatospora kifunensis TaxID=58351 RepID=A0A7W7VZY3_KITKI|nr:cellulase family glycosylhydrolase [Kitasatospora kifunensis]MBB4928214.1 hypothetical protein [Kitasatospora kifunensis]